MEECAIENELWKNVFWKKWNPNRAKCQNTPREVNSNQWLPKKFSECKEKKYNSSKILEEKVFVCPLKDQEQSFRWTGKDELAKSLDNW